MASQATEHPIWKIAFEAVTDWSTEPIASGGFGEVFTASYYGTRVAAKRLHSRFNDQALVYFEREIGIWHRLSHPHILPLLGACDKDASGKSIHPFMVSPFMPNDTLLKFVSDPSNPRSVEEKLRLLYQVAAGMSYLHGNRVVHGDLKAVNVLLDASFNSVSSSSGGTPGYMAPEMLDDEPAGTSKNTDVFAFAMTMYEVLNDGKESWVTKDNAPMKQAQIISQLLQHKRPKQFPGIPDDIWALIDRCWAHEPTDRPSFPDILVALKPYDRPVQPPAFPAADHVAVQASGIDTSRSPPQSSHLDELHFDDIADAPHLSSQLVSRAKRGDPAACLEAAKFISDGLTVRHGDWKLAAQFYKAAADGGLDSATTVGKVFPRILARHSNGPANRLNKEIVTHSSILASSIKTAGASPKTLTPPYSGTASRLTRATNTPSTVSRCLGFDN
ncbi:kinase-like domain-containing protein [Polychytrium aggregatum]|uniref:kinase-like domain-containing protein n=1 Tax=Polychytrium aggregatum TaxID=110093 RepID=UPI0022FF38B5|nr:kinase-like domain-containing protein [Polychytrium aggregatum]KAI9208770.1 kinase-like domain-containing protein [Polychytrium aggregatum]